MKEQLMSNKLHLGHLGEKNHNFWIFLVYQLFLVDSDENSWRENTEGFYPT